MNSLLELLNEVVSNAMHFGSDYADDEDHAEMTRAMNHIMERDKKLVEALKDIYNQAGEVHNPVAIARWTLKDIGEIE